MVQFFSESGQPVESASAPRLRSNYVPAIDFPVFTDGFGERTPLGGGNTSRTYTPYGVTQDLSAEETYINDVISSLSSGDGGTSISFEGLVGPQGPPGPAGPPGITTIQQQFIPLSIGVASLDVTLSQLQALGTEPNKIPVVDYTTKTGGSISPAVFSWNETQPAGDVTKAWNCLAISEDGQTMLAGEVSNIPIGGRLYRSQNGGSTWDEVQPAGDTDKLWRGVAISNDGQTMLAIALVGTVAYVSINGGNTWSAVTVSSSSVTMYGCACSSSGTSMAIACKKVVTDDPDPGPNNHFPIFVSGNSGSAWTQQSITEMTNNGDSWQSIVMDSTGYRIAATDNNEGIFITSNRGASWTQEFPVAESGWESLAMSSTGRFILVAQDENDPDEAGGVYLSSDYGSSWTKIYTAAVGEGWSQYISCDETASHILVAESGGKAYLTIERDNSFFEMPSGQSNSSWGLNVMSKDGGTAFAIKSQRLYIGDTSAGGEYTVDTWKEVTLSEFAESYLSSGSAEEFLSSSGAQAQGDILDDLNVLGVNAADGEIIVGTAAGALAWESGATARTSLGLGAGDSPTLTGLDLTGITDDNFPIIGAGGFTDSSMYVDSGNLYIGYKSLRVGNATSSQIRSYNGVSDLGVLDPTDGSRYDFYVGGATGPDLKVSFTNSGNILLGGTTNPASATRSMGIYSGTSPTGGITDGFVLYSKDFAVGNACPYFRTENGTVIGLNQSLLTTDSITVDDITISTPSNIYSSLGGLLEDLNTLGANSADGEFIVGTGAGALAWESGATARTSLGLGAGDSPQIGGLEIRGGLTTTGALLSLGTKEPTVIGEDVLGKIDFYAPLEVDGGDAILPGASIAAVAEGTFSTTVNSTRLELRTAESGVATTRVYIRSNGIVGFNTTGGAIAAAGEVANVAILNPTGAGGILELKANSATDDSKLGTINFGNESNTNSANPSSANFMGVARIQTLVETSDGNDGNDSGANLDFWSKAEASSLQRRMRIASDGGIFAYSLKSGATQGGAGAVANELWTTASHASLPDNVVMIGV